MSESRDYLEMTFRSIQCFSNDGRLDAQELKALLEIAERDGVIDDNEVRVLPEEIDAALRDKIAIVEQKIGV